MTWTCKRKSQTVNIDLEVATTAGGTCQYPVKIYQTGLISSCCNWMNAQGLFCWTAMLTFKPNKSSSLIRELQLGSFRRNNDGMRNIGQLCYFPKLLNNISVSSINLCKERWSLMPQQLNGSLMSRTFQILLHLWEPRLHRPELNQTFEGEVLWYFSNVNHFSFLIAVKDWSCLQCLHPSPPCKSLCLKNSNELSWSYLLMQSKFCTNQKEQRAIQFCECNLWAIKLCSHNYGQSRGKPEPC